MSRSFNMNKTNHLSADIFLDVSGGVDIARYDNVKYPALLKAGERMHSFFWTPEEVDLSKDRIDFKGLINNEKHIFTSNLKRQILLDSIQGRSPLTTFLPIISNPESEFDIIAIGFYESIHSKSYTHIIRNVYNDPGEVFDTIKDIPEIRDCARDVSMYYDNLHRYNCMMETDHPDYDRYEHKKAIWLALYAWNALEALRFYVSFVCSWAFGEMKKMVGNSSIIALICRDEETHRMFTAQLIKLLPKEDPDFLKIKEECIGEVTEMYLSVGEQEKGWAKYLFKDGSIIGLNEKILCEYIDWLSVKRMGVVDLQHPLKGKVGSNPLPWVDSWINSSDVQTANQETENIKYLVGAIKQDLDVKKYSNVFDLDKILKKHKISVT
jgi:ribonucleoside-diphosphate reductase beta chain